jgi:hypothetical protein
MSAAWLRAMSRSGAGLWRLKGMLVMGLALVTSLVGTATAGAVSYVEVGHYGCYQTKSCTGPKFGVPVGFTVAPTEGSEKNVVYVLSETENNFEEGKLAYKLMKLPSPSPGATTEPQPLGLTEITDDYPGEDISADHPLIDLAVDPSLGRVYALVESFVTDPSADGNEAPIVDELVAWSTKPNAAAGNKLEPLGSGYPVDQALNASIIKNFEPENEKRSFSEDLYAPEGLAVDPVNGDVVIEAQQGGPTILQRVTTSGQLDGSWLAPSVPEGEVPNGLIAKPDGSFAVDLYIPSGGEALLSHLLKVPAGLPSKPEALVPQEGSRGANRDGALTTDDPYTANRRSSEDGGAFGSGVAEAYTAGEPLAELSNGDYAARFGQAGGSDYQTEVEPWKKLGGGSGLGDFWNQEVNEEHHIGNMGIRVFSPAGEVLTTVGGGAEGEPCNLATNQLAVAAGAENSIFVLTSPNEHDGESDDELSEFAEGEGGSKACPQPTGEVEVNEAKTAPPAVAIVHEGENTKFNAISIDRAGEAPYAYEWSFEGEGKGVESESKMKGPKFDWPDPEATHQYSKTGTYHATLRLVGDYGVKTFPFTVEVEPSENAVVKIVPPASITAGESVTFSATGTKGVPGSEITEYRWNFGDGKTFNALAPEKEAHNTFASAQTYHVKLTIVYEVGEHETAEASGEIPVTVVPASENTGGNNNNGGSNNGNNGGGGPASVISPPGPGTVFSPPPVVKPPLTKAQLLADALKSCHKDKAHKKRVSCEKAAEKKYAPKKKKKKKK